MYGKISMKTYLFHSLSTGILIMIQQLKTRFQLCRLIRKFLSPRQKVNIEARGELLLSEIREKILEDFEFIGDTLHLNFCKKYFTVDEFVNVITEKYGKLKARIIANSLFDLVDTNKKCVKCRKGNSLKNYYMISNSNFKEYMRKVINKSDVIRKINKINTSSYSSYLNIAKDECSNIALKLLSIFDYASYEILGGEEPEIFIRLNDPQKVRSIVMDNTYYSNNYITQATKKHDRDTRVLRKFFEDLSTDRERWDYIEDYFLGNDVLCEQESVVQQVDNVDMMKAIDKDKSYSTNQYKTWADLSQFFDKNDHVIIDKIANMGVNIPEYLQTVIKKSDLGEAILMSWPSRNVLICQQDT